MSLDAVWNVVWIGFMKLWKVLLAPDLLPMLIPSIRTVQGDQGITYFSAEEGEGSHTAHGTWMAAPFPRDEPHSILLLACWM